MSAQIIDGKEISRTIRDEVHQRTIRLKDDRGVIPGLAFILVGDNPGSQLYVRMKGKACDEAGFYSVTERMGVETQEEVLLKKIRQFNQDPKIHGILVQLPLPSKITEQKVVETIEPAKDVDGFHPYNVGKMMAGQPGLRPCTPLGILELLMRSGNDPAGKHVVVLGRSNIVGKPVAAMLLQKQAGANAVVTVAHTGARDLLPYTQSADILIAAMGKPEVIRGEMLKHGVVVIDVGTNRIADSTARNGYRTVGDVHFDSVNKVAKAITPVPGGVGPMTIAMLLRNTLQSAEAFSQHKAL